MLELRIVTGSNVPLYQQIVDQVRWGVASGAHPVGTPLPSVRALAEQLVINPNTVARAYADLVREGVVETRAGKGCFVAEPRKVYADEERERRLDAALESFLSEALSLGYRGAAIRSAVEQRLARLESQGGTRKRERR
ncbi:MAG: GntR family transcriptional regulator [Planctomycetes bacterium]|nr:GntR family transcriptional regulator [Planctomycetota bacterium]